MLPFRMTSGGLNKTTTSQPEIYGDLIIRTGSLVEEKKFIHSSIMSVVTHENPFR